MKTVIFCNGDVSISAEDIYSILSKKNFIIAADGGYNHLKKLNIKPHMIIGDMDSITEKFDENKIETVVYSQNKDQTDTELAIQKAIERGFFNITLIGATGKRLDHTLANIELLKKYPGQIILISNNSKLIAISNNQKLTIIGKRKSLVSIFSGNTDSPRIKTFGLKYQLNYQKLKFPTQGISNVLEKDPANISVDRGILLVFTEAATQLIVDQI